MKKFFSEFKEFISKGNVIDMAVGVIIGGAFKAIVDSFTGDIVSPLLGAISNVDLSAKVAMIGDVELRYGAFITAIINFIIMALVIFLFIKAINKAKKAFEKKEEDPAPAEPTTKKCPYCFSEIPIGATRCPHCTSQLEE